MNRIYLRVFVKNYDGSCIAEIPLNEINCVAFPRVGDEIAWDEEFNTEYNDFDFDYFVVKKVHIDYGAVLTLCDICADGFYYENYDEESGLGE